MKIGHLRAYIRWSKIRAATSISVSVLFSSWAEWPPDPVKSFNPFARDGEQLDVAEMTLDHFEALAIAFAGKAPAQGREHRTVNMDVGALRRVLKRLKHWRRPEDDVKMLTESGGAPLAAY